MKRYLFATAAIAVAGQAQAADLQYGTIGGMPYVMLPASEGCSEQAPCSVVTYLSYMNEHSEATNNNVRDWFGGDFAKANPHTVIIAPKITQPNSESVSWGGFLPGTTPQQEQAVKVVQTIEQKMGNTVDPKKSVVTGGSLGGSGTESMLVHYGPKGLTQPGIFSAGLPFDGKLPGEANNPAAIEALKGVPMMAVHGTADTEHPFKFDTDLQKKVGSSMTVVPVNAGHGTWDGPSGYPAGVGPGTPLGWLSQQLANSQPTAPSETPHTLPSMTPLNPTTQPSLTPSPESTPLTVKPGDGLYVKDAQGSIFTVSSDGHVLKNDRRVTGGGDTAEVTVRNGVIYGRDNGSPGHSSPNLGKWFVLSDLDWVSMGQADPDETQPPPTAQRPSIEPTATAPDQPLPAPIAVGQEAQYACNAGVPNSPAESGGFATVEGKLLQPDGTPFIAHGVNVYSFDLASAREGLVRTFPGVNLVRLIARKRMSPASITDFVNHMTAQGIVVEIEDHPNAGGGQNSGPPGGIAAENAWYSSMAAAFKTNPYVWFGTFNEPMNVRGLSQWQEQTYNAIRGTGNGNIILLEPSGSRPQNLQQVMDPAVYAKMENVVWDPHAYNYQSNYSTDQSTVDASVHGMISAAQKIHGIDGSTIPVLVGEFGTSTTGSNVSDPGGMQEVKAVANSGVGYAAFTWTTGIAPGNMLRNRDGSLTSYGQYMAGAIRSNGPTKGCNVSPDPKLVPSNNTIQTDLLTPQNSLDSIQSPPGLR